MERTVEDIEDAITHLPEEKLIQFRAWYQKFDSDVWDEKIEKDASSGKLDSIAEMAIADHKAGK
jgi:hypothetical protein